MPVAKQARAEVSTRRLLDAARDLIAEVGYHRATLALIAQRAGYSHGLVTRRFGSKENLLYVLVERMTVTWAQREGRVRPGQGVGREAVLAPITAVIEGYRRSPGSMRGLYVLIFEALNSVPALRERIVNLHREFRRDLAATVRRSIDAGALRADTDPERVARLLISGIRGAAFQWVLDPDEVDLEAALEDVRHALEPMLASPEEI